MGTRSRTHRIGELAAAQWGVVGRRQLLDAGVTARMIGERVRDGRLVRLHRGVYAVGHARLTRDGWWLAAVLAVGPGAVLSHGDAACLHGLRPANHRRVDVTTQADRTSTPEIRVHRTRVLHADDVTAVSGIPVTSVSRTLVDLAGTIARDHLAKAVREAERRRVFDLRAVKRALARTAHRTGPGHRALREAIEEVAAFEGDLTRSPLEDVFLRLVHRAGLPSPRTNATVEGFEVDAHWPAHRLAVELDGWTDHGTRHAFQRDRERDAALIAAGWRVVRFTHHDVTRRPDAVTGLLRRLGLP